MADLRKDWLRFSVEQKLSLLYDAIGVSSSAIDDWWSWDSFGRLLRQVEQRGWLILIDSAPDNGLVYRVTIDTGSLRSHEIKKFETGWGADLRERLIFAFCLASKVEAPDKLPGTATLDERPHPLAAFCAVMNRRLRGEPEPALGEGDVL